MLALPAPCGIISSQAFLQMEKNIFAKISLGVLFFTGLLALSFSFGPTGVQFLIDSPWYWLLIVLMAVSAFLLIVFGGGIHKKSLLAIGVLYLCVPFGLYFGGGNGMRFILLEQHFNVAVGLWAIAGISMGLFLLRKTTVTTN